MFVDIAIDVLNSLLLVPQVRENCGGGWSREKRAPLIRFCCACATRQSSPVAQVSPGGSGARNADHGGARADWFLQSFWAAMRQSLAVHFEFALDSMPLPSFALLQCAPRLVDRVLQLGECTPSFARSLV